MYCVRTRPKTSFLPAITCVQEQLPLHSRKNRAVCLLSFRRALGSWPCGVRAAKQTAIYKTQGQHRLAFCVFFKFICATELEMDALRYFRQANWSLPHISNCHHLLPISFAKPLYGQKNRYNIICCNDLMAPQVRLELTTPRLTAECSTIELSRIITNVSIMWKNVSHIAAYF